MKDSAGQMVELGSDILSSSLPALLAIGAAVPLFGNAAGLIGKFYVTYQYAGVVWIHLFAFLLIHFY
jgi:hypothetical protein